MKIITEGTESLQDIFNAIADFAGADGQDISSVEDFTLNISFGDILDDNLYVIRNGEICDGEEALKQRAEVLLRQHISDEISLMEREIRSFERDRIPRMEKNLERAKTRGYSTVGYWKEQIQNGKEHLGDIRKQLEIFKAADKEMICLTGLELLADPCFDGDEYVSYGVALTKLDETWYVIGRQIKEVPEDWKPKRRDCLTLEELHV